MFYSMHWYSVLPSKRLTPGVFSNPCSRFQPAAAIAIAPLLWDPPGCKTSLHGNVEPEYVVLMLLHICGILLVDLLVPLTNS